MKTTTEYRIRLHRHPREWRDGAFRVEYRVTLPDGKRTRWGMVGPARETMEKAEEALRAHLWHSGKTEDEARRIAAAAAGRG